jgi:hypothetical protein
VFTFENVSPRTTPAVLAAVAAAHPDRDFVVAEDGTLTYAEAARRCGLPAWSPATASAFCCPTGSAGALPLSALTRPA